MQAGGEGHLPVFVFPGSINFFYDDQTSHKQVLTLYNPYEFPLKFKVMCTAPKKYSVVDSEGSIKARCCVDIVIRHKAVAPANVNISDKFRIQMHEHGNRQTFGRKEITATLLSGREDAKSDSTDSDQYKQLDPGRAGLGRQSSSSPGPARSYSMMKGHAGSSRAEEHGHPRYNAIAIMVGVVCTFALLMPTFDVGGECDASGSPAVTASMRVRSVIPEYLHVTFNQKLICAYALGLVTMVLLRT